MSYQYQPQGFQQRYVTPLTDQQPPSTVVVVIAWVLTVLGSFYLLPWAIAASRGKSNQWPVFWINLFLGWTVIGWFAALVMACTAHRPVLPFVAMTPMLPQAPSAPAAGWYTNPDGYGQRFFDGQGWTDHVRS